MTDDIAANAQDDEACSSDPQRQADLIEQTSGQQHDADASAKAHRKAEEAERRSGDQDQLEG